MRRALSLFLVTLLFPCSVLADGFVAVGGGGGITSSVLFEDMYQNSYTNTQCADIRSIGNVAAACTNANTKYYVAVSTRITRLDVALASGLSANSGCAFTFATNAGDATMATKPAIGDSATVEGYNMLTADGATASIALNVTVAAGGYFQLKMSDLAAGSAGNDGSCANASGGGTTLIRWRAYGR